MDPYERADITSDQYYDFIFKNAYLAAYAQSKVAPFLQSFKEYPPRQRPASFSIDQMMERLEKQIGMPPPSGTGGRALQ
jgi:arylsulfatase